MRLFCCQRIFYLKGRILLIMGSRKKHVKIEYEGNEDGGGGQSSDTKKRKFVPKNWETVLENIREMRSVRDAPVDTMGCAQCADKKASLTDQQYQILVALMLSSQTKDAVTYAACQRLQEFGFTAKSLADADVNEIEDLIKPVGFYKTKAKHIKQSSQMLLNDFNGEVPNELESLLKFPGVGKKMANIALAECFDNVVGIGVDVHVHRIANRLNWTSKPTKTPEQTQQELESWLPRDVWREVNLLLVGFGQQICTPKAPHCENCLNSSNNLCPYAFKEEKPKKKKN